MAQQFVSKVDNKSYIVSTSCTRAFQCARSAFAVFSSREGTNDFRFINNLLIQRINGRTVTLNQIFKLRSHGFTDVLTLDFFIHLN